MYRSDTIVLASYEDAASILSSKTVWILQIIKTAFTLFDETDNKDMKCFAKTFHVENFL